MSRALIIASIVVLAGLSLPAEELPYGHPDFVASRERPIGWRGDMRGAFLGATMPQPWNTATGEGVLWKVPMPNWASCGCIVVGDKVITRASPHTLLCYDANTGELLWHNKDDIWTYHFKDDPTKAEEMRVLTGKWERQLYLGWGQQGKDRVRPWTVEEKDEWLQVTKDIMENHPELSDEGSGKAKKPPSKEWQALFEKALSGWWPNDPRETIAIMGKDSFRVSGHCSLFIKYGFTGNKYRNSEDKTISTPVCDGTYIYTASGYGLICCYELATGKTKWMSWTGMPKTLAGHGDEWWPSPWIYDDRLIVYNNYRLRGFDLDSGEQLWSVAVKFEDIPDILPQPSRKALGNTGHTHADNCAFLEVGGVKVVVTSTGHVVRAKDGVVLSEDVLGTQFGASYEIVPSCDKTDIVIISHGSGQGGKGHARTAEIRNKPQVEAWKLSMDGETLQTELLWIRPRKGTGPNGEPPLSVGIGPVVHDGVLYVGPNKVDMATGKDLGNVKANDRRNGRYQGYIMMQGPTIFSMPDGIGPEPAKSASWTLQEPFEFGEAKFISQRDDWLVVQDGKPFFKEPEAHPYRALARKAYEDGLLGWLDAPPIDSGWSNNLYGQPGFPVGDRLYVRSRAFLYCFGSK